MNFHVLGPKILKVRAVKFLTQFLKLYSFPNTGKVWWQSAKEPPRLRVEKKKKEISAAKHSGCIPSLNRLAHISGICKWNPCILSQFSQ